MMEKNREFLNWNPDKVHICSMCQTHWTKSYFHILYKQLVKNRKCLNCYLKNLRNKYNEK